MTAVATERAAPSRLRQGSRHRDSRRAVETMSSSGVAPPDSLHTYLSNYRASGCPAPPEQLVSGSLHCALSCETLAAVPPDTGHVHAKTLPRFGGRRDLPADRGNEPRLPIS